MLYKLRPNGCISGFTLVELLVVVMILGALAGIALPRISSAAQTAKERACQTNLDIINSQAEVYFSIEGDYPSDISKLTGDSDYFPDGVPKCPLLGTYSLNSNHRATCSKCNLTVTVTPITSPARPVASPFM